MSEWIMRQKRGRPAGQMTHRRQQVLDELIRRAVEDRAPPSWSELARRCGLYDYRAAKRIARELQTMGKLSRRFTPVLAK